MVTFNKGVMNVFRNPEITELAMYYGDSGLVIIVPQVNPEI